MRFRKLRIAFSVTCAIACVLLIALWVRSYWTVDSVDWQRSGWRHDLRINSVHGGAGIAWRENGYDASIMKFEHGSIVGRLLLLQDGERTTFWWFHKLMPGEAYIPFWPLVLVSGMLAAMPWIRWRFTLRTLLIATTLVAVVLGLIVWLR
jgi:hypothetical protein